MIVAIMAMAGIVILVCVLIFLVNEKKGIKRFQGQRRSMFVSSGVDVQEQVLGTEKGAFFTGNLRESLTVCARSQDCKHMAGKKEKNAVWRISFQNMDSGEILSAHFRVRLLAGRYPIAKPDETAVSFQGDTGMSKTQFVIYEAEGRICLADANSRNHTYINGKCVNAPVFLNRGDVIRAGNTKLKVEYMRQ